MVLQWAQEINILGAPSDFLAPFSLTIFNSAAGDDAKEYLEFKDLSFIETFHPDYNVQGKPRYYAQFDVGNFILAPTPDAAMTLKFSICIDLLV